MADELFEARLRMARTLKKKMGIKKGGKEKTVLDDEKSNTTEMAALNPTKKTDESNIEMNKDTEDKKESTLEKKDGDWDV